MYTDKDEKSVRTRFTCLCPARLCLGRQGRQACLLADRSACIRVLFVPVLVKGLSSND